eukprot:397341-Rhodomonas_salina.2
MKDAGGWEGERELRDATLTSMHTSAAATVGQGATKTRSPPKPSEGHDPFSQTDSVGWARHTAMQYCVGKSSRTLIRQHPVLASDIAQHADAVHRMDLNSSSDLYTCLLTLCCLPLPPWSHHTQCHKRTSH